MWKGLGSSLHNECIPREHSKSEIPSCSVLRLSSLQPKANLKTSPVRSLPWRDHNSQSCGKISSGSWSSLNCCSPSCWDSDQDLVKVSGIFVFHLQDMTRPRIPGV